MRTDKIAVYHPDIDPYISMLGIWSPLSKGALNPMPYLTKAEYMTGLGHVFEWKGLSRSKRGKEERIAQVNLLYRGLHVQILEKEMGVYAAPYAHYRANEELYTRFWRVIQFRVEMLGGTWKWTLCGPSSRDASPAHKIPTLFWKGPTDSRRWPSPQDLENPEVASVWWARVKSVIVSQTGAYKDNTLWTKEA